MPPLPDDPLLRLYRDMMLIRRFEEKAGQLYGMGLIGGFCPLSIGHEALAVGLDSIARPGDRRITGPRCHAMALACGIAPERIMAELLGRDTGLCGGHGGPMHLFSKAHGFFGGHAAPGAQAPLAVGLALAQRDRDPAGAITLCCLGDGAALQGQVSEAYALAETWALPVLFVIENNGPGAKGTPLARAQGCGLVGETVDGSDVLAVRDAAGRAANAMRATPEPRVIEAGLERFRGHALDQSDPERLAARRARAARDPLVRHAEHLTKLGHGREILQGIDDAVRAEVAEAARFARDSPLPPALAPLGTG